MLTTFYDTIAPAAGDGFSISCNFVEWNYGTRIKIICTLVFK